ncbi:MAG TPA: cytochrome c oxidase assembly protein [Pseudolabrys sp.]|nr:cytochrome c oxidase assembly protein [Pseudolabrys sp.]
MTARFDKTHRKPLSRDVLVASCCGALVAGMVGAAYASVPFYNWFCKTTGFGGTPQVAESAPDHVLGRTLTIRFDSNVSSGLPWKFQPEQNAIQVRVGEVATVHYKVVNEAAREIAAQASYNVSPPTIGAYFDKINCFCFTEQRLKPGETRDMTVVFYVDPAIAKDRDQNDLNVITLSYTFYRLRDPEQPVAEAPDKKSSKL